MFGPFRLGVSLSLLVLSVPVAAQGLLDNDIRIHRVGHQLATRNLAMCPDTKGWWSGIVATSIGLWPKAERAAAAQQLGLVSQSPVIMAIIPGSAADKAGLRVGDAIVSINGDALPATHGARASYDALLAFENGLELADAALNIERAGKAVPIQLSLTPGCATRMTLKESGKLNAAADGIYVEVTRAIAEFARDDDELAFVIAHEMAHNIKAHPQMLKREGKKKSRVKETEIEADRMAVRMMHAAGYDPNAAVRFWQRFGKRTGWGIFSDGTHLRTKPRIALLEEEARKLIAQ